MCFISALPMLSFHYIIADVDVLKLNNSTEDNDPFVQKLMMMDENGDYPVVTVDRHILASLHWTSVIVKKWPFPLKYQYYCSQIPNVPIRLCSSCNQVLCIINAIIISFVYNRCSTLKIMNYMSYAMVNAHFAGNPNSLRHEIYYND